MAIENIPGGLPLGTRLLEMKNILYENVSPPDWRVYY
jgi:hypothetical protein